MVYVVCSEKLTSHESFPALSFTKCMALFKAHHKGYRDENPHLPSLYSTTLIFEICALRSMNSLQILCFQDSVFADYLPELRQELKMISTNDYSNFEDEMSAAFDNPQKHKWREGYVYLFFRLILTMGSLDSLFCYCIVRYLIRTVN